MDNHPDALIHVVADIGRLTPHNPHRNTHLDDAVKYSLYGVITESESGAQSPPPPMNYVRDKTITTIHTYLFLDTLTRKDYGPLLDKAFIRTSDSEMDKLFYDNLSKLPICTVARTFYCFNNMTDEVICKLEDKIQDTTFEPANELCRHFWIKQIDQTTMYGHLVSDIRKLLPVAPLSVTYNITIFKPKGSK